MPGTEYQFRLRAYSNGSWQEKEESVVSSPFKTICSPPDPPPTCPRTRQLGSDPLVLGGLVDTGALLSAKTSEVSCNSRISESGVGDVCVKTSSNVGRREAGAAAAAASAAAIGRGKAQAEAEWNNGGNMSGLGEVVRGGHDDDDREDGMKDHNGDAADVGRSRVKDMRKIYDNSEGAAETAVDGGARRKRRNSGNGRRGEQGARRPEPYEGGGGNGQEQTQEARPGHKHLRRRLSGLNAQDPGHTATLLPALTDKTKEGQKRAEEETGNEANSKQEAGCAVVAAESDTKGSTTMVLEWDSGCTNGAITTNYEVSGEVLNS